LGTNTTIVGTNSILYFQAYSATLNNKIWRIINYSDGRLIFEALSDDLSVRQSYTLQLDRVGNALIQGDIYEKTRTTPIGHWISFTPTFAVDTGTITLNTAYTAKYTLIGKTIILSIRASITLSIAVPAYFMFTPVIGASYTTTPINDNIDTIGVVQSLPGEGRIVIYHNLSATINWTAGAHEIGFTISYEFQ
jgi:hypothetical protein